MVELKTTCGTPFMVDDDIAARVRHLAWKLDKDGYVIRRWANARIRRAAYRLARAQRPTGHKEST